ncbi:GNAT family N-acetyltransferase [Agromyces aurantiacus]|uniref:GNAT family N-acetyltransferase n=1 Tax=Agromyces aurantiacus TaxID=165814 RepID=A0ABV9R3E9_9MICO|nr:GNAT family N-acetyltransferase [Agromyces aurantiacus]MBM7502640.1 ribosomal protein S18 acetylase RimI-like enzyme [Agromyces aurantiacus]
MTAERVELVLKSDAQVAEWLPVAMAHYEQARVEAGDSPAQAAAGRRASEERFFPGGRIVEGQLLHTIRLGVEDAGWLWIGPWDSEGSLWWVWDLMVHPEFRRRGIARDAMLAAERIAREHGATSLMLNVFAFNEGAIALYEALGYHPASIHMAKPL